jgi:hypothetical protein
MFEGRPAYRLPGSGPLLLLAAMLSACGGGGSGTGSSTVPPGSMPGPASVSPPTIGGTPATTATAGSAYSFTPTTTSPGGRTLTFAVSNAPPWATFSTSTGQLSGTPGDNDVGNNANVAITVSDGSNTVSLPAFTITVNVAPGAARLAWTAPSQNADGSAFTNLAGFNVYYGNYPASLTQVSQIANPSLTSTTIKGLTSGTWYFALATYSTAGISSGLSVPVSKTIP